jgi:hypothetical protein
MCIDKAAMCVTCKKLGLAHLLKTTSCRQFSIAQTKAHPLQRIWALILLPIPFNQKPKRSVILVGGGIL